jgi:hypothetical protein
MVVVGASFTAGVGASSPAASWAYLLAGYLGWRADVRAVPGAGYVRAGKDDMGPVGRLLAEGDLARTSPSLVVVQAGHDDIGEPSSLITKRETADLQLVRKLAPDARLAIISVFLRHGIEPSQRDIQTNNTIVATAEKVDPGVIVFNPIAGHWHFKRAGGGLHPDEAGDAWIARHVAEGLVARGVTDFNSKACLTAVTPAAEGCGTKVLSSRAHRGRGAGCQVGWPGRLRTAPLLAGPSGGGFGAGQASKDGSKCGRTGENDHNRAYDYYRPG